MPTKDSQSKIITQELDEGNETGKIEKSSQFDDYLPGWGEGYSGEEDEQEGEDDDEGEGEENE